MLVDEAGHFGRTPSLWRRLSCWFYEGMLLFGVIFIAGYLFGALSQTKHALDNRHGLQAFVFLVLAIYFTSAGESGAPPAIRASVLFMSALILGLNPSGSTPPPLTNL